jgi:YidC/Oxa1 family membrane protein insertase
MDRNAIVRTLLIGLIIFGGWWFFFGKKSSEHPQQIPVTTYVDAPGFAPDVIDVAPGQPAPAPPPPGQMCTIDGDRFRAVLSSRGAGLTHFYLTDPRYANSDVGRPGVRGDMSTTPDIERWRSLRTEFRTHPGAPTSPDDQVPYDRFDWQLERLGTTGCRFTYEDPGRVRVVKTVTTDGRPFELKVETTLTNLSDAPKQHQTSVEEFAYRTNKDVESHLGRVSPFQTDLECARGGDVKRLGKDAKEFQTGWYSEPLDDRFAAISDYYFGQALVPLSAAPGAGGDKPSCDLLSEHGWRLNEQGSSDDTEGDVYHAKLTYPERVLGPKESVTYGDVAYFGPKERDVLAKAAGGWPHLQDLINLGTFSIVAKVLVEIITWIHAHITLGNWGLAIIVLTLGLRTVLFPLTWKQIKSTIAMRRLKPEIDALNAKFKADPQAKNLAMMELWRKHKVNPLGGCLPALVQMPIWFALYATLQTAVEFYHTKFLWFSDLSAPDQLFFHTIGPLPLILGAAMIVQQRIVPQQGMDPMQQKMMMWLMPGVFTVMMLFLPAALGVYMLTNSVLGIVQQLAIEKFFPRVGAPGGATTSGAASGKDIVVKPEKTGKGAATPALRKGKARV